MADFVYGIKSSERIATCHPKLQHVATRAITMTPIDFTIVHGWRGMLIQNTLFDSGASEKEWPDSMHNNEEEDADGVRMPCSLAIDFAPWINGKIPWKETHSFAVVAGVWFVAAKECGVILRWGGDWNMNGLTTDQLLMDFGHVEIRL